MEAMADHWLKALVFVIVLSSVQVLGDRVMNITRLHSAVAKGAVCLDGSSPPAYYFDKGVGESADNWIVYLEGGGWCGSDYMCTNRTHEAHGNSSMLPDQTAWGGILHTNESVNPGFAQWTKAFVRYCDGASFLADVEEVDPKTNFHFRGARIFRAVVEDLLARGMNNAKNVMLAGNSAGGLATIMNCDNFRALLPPNISRVKCVADSGFFIRAKNLPGVDKVRDSTFASIIKYHGLAKNLPKSCTSKMDPNLCLYPENVIADIKTPLFLVNSAFDKYQLGARLPAIPENWGNCTSGTLPCTPPQVKAIQDFGRTFYENLPKFPHQQVGLYIDTCLLHDHFYQNAYWNGQVINVNNKTMVKAVEDWFFERSSDNYIENGSYFRLCPI